MRRALHYVLKVGDRTKSVDFYTRTLGMKVLRHEEFSEGCQATCNGPYDGKWSKTMIGYGPEDDYFVLELTYNYGIGKYVLGNDLQSITLKGDTTSTLTDPDGRSIIINSAAPRSNSNDMVQKVSIAASSMAKSVDFWTNICGMSLCRSDANTCLLTYSPDQCHLELKYVPNIVRGTGFGRIAFSCPQNELALIQQLVEDNGCTVLTRLISLPTPGKATVQVVIIADPDGHEICFVGDKAFRELSVADPNAQHLLDKAIAEDDSQQWFADKGGKVTA